MTKNFLRVKASTHGYSCSPIFADVYWNPQLEQQALLTLLGRQVDGIVVLGGGSDEAFLADVGRIEIGEAAAQSILDLLNARPSGADTPAAPKLPRHEFRAELLVRESLKRVVPAFPST